MAESASWGAGTWNTPGFAASPQNNTMDAESMPSKQAQAARERAAEVIEASKNEKPGEADAMMGKRETRNGQIIPMKWLKTKFSGKKEKKVDQVIR